MVSRIEKSILSADGIHQLAGTVYLPAGEPVGIFHMVHGMVEHKERYDELLTQIAACGWVCLAFDNLGHGASVSDESELGFIAEREGWKLLCEDVYAFGNEMKRVYGDLPYVLAGHSMGSFIVRLTASRFPVVMLDGIIRKEGERSYSDFAEKLSIGGYNDSFKNEEDALSWLNTLKTERDIYRADKLCAFRFTVSAMRDLVALNIACNSRRCFKNIKKSLPILMLSGAEDPARHRRMEGIQELRENGSHQRAHQALQGLPPRDYARCVQGRIHGGYPPLHRRALSRLLTAESRNERKYAVPKMMPADSSTYHSGRVLISRNE